MGRWILCEAGDMVVSIKCVAARGFNGILEITWAAEIECCCGIESAARGFCGFYKNTWAADIVGCWAIVCLRPADFIHL